LRASPGALPNEAGNAAQGILTSSAETDTELASDVRCGLVASHKWLPPYLFYDAAGSALYEQITELEEYYLTRAERSIFATYATQMAAAARDAQGRTLGLIEFGAGSASKTFLLLQELVRRQGVTSYTPIDVSRTALAEACERLKVSLPFVTTEPWAMTYTEALAQLGRLKDPQLILFIGSSIGNLDDHAAVKLLGAVRKALGRPTWLILGTDLKKSPARLLPAYDDALGVTAAFNKNLLVRLNRELGAHFDVRRFMHRAIWNEKESQIEMHLESIGAQRVAVDALELDVQFAAGETIHTESSAKYDLQRVDAILTGAGFQRLQTWYDDERLYAVHIAS
jgi:L-histidine N-alpha-methyltransferase